MPTKINSNRRICKKCSIEFELSGSRHGRRNLLCPEHYRFYSREKVKEARKKNPQEARAKDLIFRNRNKLKIAIYSKKYRQKFKDSDPVGYRLVSFNRQYKSKINSKNIEKYMLDQNNRCVGCGDSLIGGFHIDHIIPISRGGKTEIANLQLLCEPCNRSKFSWSWSFFIEHASKIATYHNSHLGALPSKP